MAEVGLLLIGGLLVGVVFVLWGSDLLAGQETPDEEEPDFAEELRRKELEGLRAERDRCFREMDEAATALLVIANKLQQKMIDHPNN